MTMIKYFIKLILIILIIIIFISLIKCNISMIKEGTIRLVGGSTSNEGNVEIYHMNRWGSICDDEWDENDGLVACKSLSYNNIYKVTDNSRFGKSRKLIWMDNLYCNGTERYLQECSFDGWKIHDCSRHEAAGVICLNDSQQHNLNNNNDDYHHHTQIMHDQSNEFNIFYDKNPLDGIKIRITGGRNKNEGRVEVKTKYSFKWGNICGYGWSLSEAMVVCRSAGLGYAQYAISSSHFGGENNSYLLNGLSCKGFEKSIEFCTHRNNEKCDNGEIAGVICTKDLPDLVPDEKEIETSAYLEDRQLFLLQCALEENCLSSTAYTSERNYGWYFETRRLLRFTARIGNIGNADFLPLLPKIQWDWHTCHQHYHSMEVFAHYEIFSLQWIRKAEGHKASFCLEDNSCLSSSSIKYKCASYGDQGISVGCSDTYKASIDCQWIDITNLEYGIYYFKVSINPEYKVSEITFDNNAVLCIFHYTNISGKLHNCTLTSPS